MLRNLPDEEKAETIKAYKASINQTLNDITQKLPLSGIKLSSHAFYRKEDKVFVAVIRINGDRAEYPHKDATHLIDILIRVVAPILPAMIDSIKKIKLDERRKLKAKILAKRTQN